MNNKIIIKKKERRREPKGILTLHGSVVSHYGILGQAGLQHQSFNEPWPSIACRSRENGKWILTVLKSIH
jgi:hypothetical protein